MYQLVTPLAEVSGDSVGEKWRDQTMQELQALWGCLHCVQGGTAGEDQGFGPRRCAEIKPASPEEGLPVDAQAGKAALRR